MNTNIEQSIIFYNDCLSPNKETKVSSWRDTFNAKAKISIWWIWYLVYWKKIVGDDVKNLINSVSKKKIAQKVGDALISGATTSLVKKVGKSLNKVIKSKEKPFKVTQSILDKLPTVSGTGIVRD